MPDPLITAPADDTPGAGPAPAGSGPGLLPLLAVGVTLLLWSSAFVAIRHLGDHLTPGSLSLGRLVVASVCLGAVLLSRTWVPPSRSDWLRLVTVGVLWFALYNLALNAGERLVDAGTAAMLIQVSPVLIALLAVVFLGERSSTWLWVGLVVAFVGVAVISATTQPGAERNVAGVLLCLVSAAAYSVSVVIQKPLMRRLSALQVTWVACTVGMVACLPFAGQLVGDLQAASRSDVVWVVYLGALPTAVAFTTYGYALSRMNASSLGVTTYLVPPLTVLLSWLLLAETPPALTYAGGALCLVGVALARRRPRARPPVGLPASG